MSSIKCFESDLTRQNTDALEIIVKNELQNDRDLSSVMERQSISRPVSIGIAKNLTHISCTVYGVDGAVLIGLPLRAMVSKIARLAPTRDEINEDNPSKFWLDAGRWQRAKDNRLLDATEDPISQHPAEFLKEFITGSILENRGAAAITSWIEIVLEHLVEDGEGASDIREKLFEKVREKMLQSYS